MTAQIPCAGGYTLLCDDGDVDALVSVRWHANGEKRPVSVVGGQNCYPHRLVFGTPPQGFVIDHINRDPWDNRRVNLRLCLFAENLRNRQTQRKADGSGKGVRPCGSRWRAAIGFEGKLYHLGGYDDPHEAELAYDAAALFLHGEFACLNHPDAGTQPRSPEEIQTAWPRHNRKADRLRASVRELAKEGLNGVEISRRVGCSRARVSQILNEAA